VAAGAGAAACPDEPAAPLADATALPQPAQKPAPSGTDAPQFAQKAISHSRLGPRTSKAEPARVLDADCLPWGNRSNLLAPKRYSFAVDGASLNVEFSFALHPMTGIGSG